MSKWNLGFHVNYEGSDGSTTRKPSLDKTAQRRWLILTLIGFGSFAIGFGSFLIALLKFYGLGQ